MGSGDYMREAFDTQLNILLVEEDRVLAGFVCEGLQDDRALSMLVMMGGRGCGW